MRSGLLSQYLNRNQKIFGIGYLAQFRVNNLEVAKLRRMDWVVGMWNCNVELQFLELSSIPGTELMSVPGGLWNCSSRSSR